MNNRKTMTGRSALVATIAFAMFASVVSAAEADETATSYNWDAAKLGAGIALGLAGVGTGLSQGPIGAAAVGMIAEDSSKFVTGLIFTALPETIVLFGFLALFLL